MQRYVAGIVIVCVIVLFGICWWAVTREHRCDAPWQAVMFDDADLLTSPDNRLPTGWVAGAPGVRIGEFSVDENQRSIHMLGIGSWLQLPNLAVSSSQRICASVLAISDGTSATAVRMRWYWMHNDTVIAEKISPWQPVRKWQGEADQQAWSRIVATDQAPEGATTLQIRLEPASDDRIYLDYVRVRTSRALATMPLATPDRQGVRIRPWPAGYAAAVSFSFDWETAMGGLVHSRSVDDPNAELDPLLRGMRMREGVTTTLAVFAPYNYTATYYVNGYNFLDGNREQRRFMGDPMFAWATPANGWQTAAWQTQPWFAQDPYTDATQDPAWYFGDLIPVVRRAGHDIQSHTFSHFYGGYATIPEWQADLQTWNDIAAEKHVPAARSLAFPWSSSAGMSYAAWQELADAGITSVTRTSWNPKLPQYHIVNASEARCRPLPGHESIMVCPDYYLTVERTPGALAVLADIRTKDGMIDFWAHTEEVISPDQIAAWQSVVDAVAASNDVWVASLRDIAHRQQIIDQLALRFESPYSSLVVCNPTNFSIDDVVVQLPQPYDFAYNGSDEFVVSLSASECVRIKVHHHEG
jgi:peptidoglycan/xylan/chitin deacetylase (PgdA/CDA1 family)